MMRIGIIGAGLMGSSIAKNIQNAGHAINVLEHSGNQSIKDLVQAGAMPHNSIRDVTLESDVVVICVTGTPEVEQCMLGESGILETRKEGLLVVDCSTSMPNSTRKLARLAQDRNFSFIDAAMTGTTKTAKKGLIGLLVGANHDQFNRALPLFNSFAKSILHVGKVGAGHELKLLHNYVSLGWAAILGDAYAAAQSAGISPEIFVEVLEAGAGKGVMLDRLTPYLYHTDPSNFEFTINNSAKDLSYFLDTITSQDGHTKLIGTLRELYKEASRNGYGDKFVPELAEHIKKIN